MKKSDDYVGKVKMKKLETHAMSKKTDSVKRQTESAKKKSGRHVSSGTGSKTENAVIPGKNKAVKYVPKQEQNREIAKIDHRMIKDEGQGKIKDQQKPKKQGTMKKEQNNFCPLAKRCGGCTMMGMSYEQQLAEKKRQVADILHDICPVRGIIGMEDPFYYRNKVHAVFDRTKDGKIISGIYEEGTHHVICVDQCMIENRTADAIIRDIRDLLPSFKIKTYDEDTGYGLFRHVLIRTGFHSGEVMVVLVLSSPVLPSKNNFVKALRALHPEITTIVLNVNDQKTSMVLGQRNITLYGKGYIEDQLCGYTFRISPSSFYQVNPAQTEVLYRKALELAALTGKERVMDAYCGTGTIGIIASEKAGEVLGIELNPDAIRDAVSNAKRNQVKNIRFYQADAGEFMVQMAEKGETADVVIMDPPRSGSSEAFISAVAKLKPDKVVYVSCSPETLARDLRSFVKKGYRAAEAWGVDMFPWTGHVECVVLMSRVEK